MKADLARIRWDEASGVAVSQPGTRSSTLGTRTSTGLRQHVCRQGVAAREKRLVRIIDASTHDAFQKNFC